MPTTPSTDIEVAQKAMVLIGLEPLTSFTDATDEALVANTIYEDVVTDCLAQHNWNFDHARSSHNGGCEWVKSSCRRGLECHGSRW